TLATSTAPTSRATLSLTAARIAAARSPTANPDRLIRGIGLAKPLWSCRFVLMLSTLFRAAFSIRTFPPRGFAPIARDDRALVLGLLGHRGRVGLGWTSPLPDGQGPHLSGYNPVQKICMS